MKNKTAPTVMVETRTVTAATVIIAALCFLLALVSVISLGVHFNSVH